MRLIHLRIANFRGIVSSEVDFATTGITIVQGPNEVGKTSLGEAISLLFEYMDSSKHRMVEAIRPVHRDEGPEIELQAESGQYTFTYFKRFHKKPETRLTITRPKPENYTGREAHERAEAILRETLDIALWKALTIQQGDAIEQPLLSSQTSLSAALDKAAGGRPIDPRAEGLFSRVREEYLRYYTETGAERKDLQGCRKTELDAIAEVDSNEQAIISLEKDIERSAALKRELELLKVQEGGQEKAVAQYATALEEISALENALETTRLKLESAAKTEEAVRRDKEVRQGLIDAVEKATDACKAAKEKNTDSHSSLAHAEDELRKAQLAFSSVDIRRKSADALAVLRRADFDYYNSKLHLDQLSERKQRIDQARRDAAHAEDVLARNKVDDRLLKAIEDAERAYLTASAKLETGAPSVILRGLTECNFSIDEAKVRLGKGETRTISVADKSILTLPELLELQIVAGSSSEALSLQLEGARRSLEKACALAGVTSSDDARKAIEERREASRQVENKRRVERDDLRDLSYDELEQKLLSLQRSVLDYIARRVNDPAISADLDASKKERTNAEASLQNINTEWETEQKALEMARKSRDEFDTTYQETRVQLELLEKGLRQSLESLEKARAKVSDDTLEANLNAALQVKADEDAKVRSASESYNAKSPERVRSLAEACAGSLKTTQNRRIAATLEYTEVQTRLKFHGEEGLHEKLQSSQIRLERIKLQNRALFRRAAVAKLLFNTLRLEREKARQAYVAPLKQKIEHLGNLVFDDSFQVDVSNDLQIVSRTSNGVTVPFGSLSGGTKEQLSLIFRLACSMIVAKEGGMPLMLDDALGYTDPNRLVLMGAVLSQAAKECQIIILTCVPSRYSNVGEAKIVALSPSKEDSLVY